MVQRLPCGLHIVRTESRRHRLDALSLTGQQETLAVVLQRRVSILVSRGGRQALYICRETLLLWAWRGGPDATKQFYIKMYFYDPVVLGLFPRNFHARRNRADPKLRVSSNSAIATQWCPSAAAGSLHSYKR